MDKHSEELQPQQHKPVLGGLSGQEKAAKRAPLANEFSRVDCKNILGDSTAEN